MTDDKVVTGRSDLSGVAPMPKMRAVAIVGNPFYKRLISTIDRPGAQSEFLDLKRKIEEHSDEELEACLREEAEEIRDKLLPIKLIGEQYRVTLVEAELNKRQRKSDQKRIDEARSHDWKVQILSLLIGAALGIIGTLIVSTFT
jgi:hypothetical protein